MDIQTTNDNLPKLKIPSLFDSPKNPKLTPNPLGFTTESSMEETAKVTPQKKDSDKKQKNYRTSENWYG
ncbi:MAG: hypothetical protein FD143_730 [Ignavibacteria bacterium]|nr:MAG: hypothetical protein FD143_730 [Ignavibacteria bacterium]KAF0161343.1 MAG: hypothetical protein FD188_931 [Ignavibacteria bacterium]